MNQRSELGQFLFEMAGEMAKARARIYKHNALDAHYQTIQKCRVEGCENEARWPFSTCDECTAETAVGA